MRKQRDDSSMKRLVGSIAFCCLFLMFFSCQKEDITGKKLRFICEDLQPYNYVENEKLKGITVEVVGQIGGLMGLKGFTVEVREWEDALYELENSDNVALFTTGYTTLRKDKFQWVGPVTMFIDGFMGLKSSGLIIRTLGDAKALSAVGVVNNYATTEALESQGFDNLVYFNTLNEAVEALYAGTVQVVFNVTNSIHLIAGNEGYDTGDLEEKFVNSSTQGFIAFSKEVSPILVQSWQEQLDHLKRTGALQKIYDTYLPGIKAPGLLTVYSYENPTLNYRDTDGSLTGSSYDMVQAMMSITEREEPLTFTTFTDVIDQVMLAPNSMAFSVLRTPERESRFQWIGPICKKNYCFYIPAGSSQTITSLEDAKALSSVGVPAGWAAEQELINLGFTNLRTWPTPDQVFIEMMNGTVEAAVLNDISIRFLAEAAGYQFEDVKNALFLSRGESYMAFSLDTNPEWLEDWQQAYTTIVNNGTLEQIWDQWYPGIDW